MISNRDIKKISRNLLSKGKWIKFGLIAVLIELIIVASGYYFQTYITPISKNIAFSLASNSAISYFIGTVGLVVFLYLSMRILFEKSSVQEGFSLIKTAFIKNIVYKVILDVVVLVISGILSFILFPFVVASFIGKGSIYEIFGILIDVETTLVLLISSLVIFIVVVYVQYMYFLTFYLNMLEDNDNGIFNNMKFSRSLMKGNKLKLFALNLSFIFWGLISVVSLGLLLVYVIPYIYVANAVFFQEVVKNNNDVLEKFDMNDNTGIKRVIDNSVLVSKDTESYSEEDMNIASENIENTDENFESEAMEDSKIYDDTITDVDEDNNEKDTNIDENVKAMISETFESEDVIEETKTDELSDDIEFEKMFINKVENDKVKEIDIFSEIAKELNNKVR